jgi:leucyl aminopeptidase (aminopeptidase T)
MASRIVAALEVSAGERVLLRVDPATMAPLAPAVRSLLEARGAIVDALDIDYRNLAARMDRAIAQLRAGEVRVTTPHGTDIRFRVGDRPYPLLPSAKARNDRFPRLSAAEVARASPATHAPARLSPRQTVS